MKDALSILSPKMCSPSIPGAQGFPRQELVHELIRYYSAGFNSKAAGLRNRTESNGIRQTRVSRLKNGGGGGALWEIRCRKRWQQAIEVTLTPEQGCGNLKVLQIPAIALTSFERATQFFMGNIHVPSCAACRTASSLKRELFACESSPISDGAGVEQAVCQGLSLL